MEFVKGRCSCSRNWKHTTKFPLWKKYRIRDPIVDEYQSIRKETRFSSWEMIVIHSSRNNYLSKNIWVHLTVHLSVGLCDLRFCNDTMEWNITCWCWKSYIILRWQARTRPNWIGTNQSLKWNALAKTILHHEIYLVR